MSTTKQAISRRDFLRTSAAVGGGLLIAIHLPKLASATESFAPADPFAPNAFIRIRSDDIITVIINKSEMGQGPYTSLAMLAAEELEADWSKVRYESAPVDPAYNHPVFGIQMTGGSTSTASEWERFRKAGATARVMLIAAAGQNWNVDPKSLRAEKSFVIDSASGRRASFGSLADAAAKLQPPKDVTLKDPKDYKIIGKSTRRLDTPAKVNGTAQFGIDVQAPGLLTAVVARSPVFGGKVLSFNADKARAVPGVVDVVQIPSGVAVIGKGFWPAKLGRDKLEVKWDDGANASLSTTAMRADFAKLAQSPGLVAKKVGDPGKTLAGAAKTITAEFEVPYLAHATMEPLNCVVDLKSDACEIWTGTQFQTGDRMAAATIAGLKPEQVKIHTTFLGGGFGRRANPANDFVGEAVHVAKAIKSPVKVVWTREDDMHGGYYRPMWYDRMVGGVDANGNPIAWTHTIVGQSIMLGTPFEQFGIQNGIDTTSVEGAADLLYGIPNVQVDLHTPKLTIPVLWWRSVGHSHNGFAVEAFLDELAHLGGKDPVQLRRTLLTNQPRMKALLDLVAEKAKWDSPVPAGRGRGIATHFSFDSYVAQVAEVSVDKTGEVRVHKVVCAVDCGRVVNPDSVIAQMQGGIVFGLSAALKDAITFENGRVQQRNFHDYPMVRMNESPEIEVHIMPSTEPPTGVGEPGVPPVAPAVANAIFAATGKRVRRLPIGRVDMG
ncbi:MAG: twin-arginine translocation pathway signal protein [Blastocatellia bacterium]|nr:MAG: twin-arginine translocation pathway signal protein [Blastocatellia bacterium]